MQKFAFALAALFAFGLAACANNDYTPSPDPYYDRPAEASGPPAPKSASHYKIVDGQWSLVTPQGSTNQPAPQDGPSQAQSYTDVHIGIYQPTICPRGIGGMLFAPPECSYGYGYPYYGGYGYGGNTILNFGLGGGGGHHGGWNGSRGGSGRHH